MPASIRAVVPLICALVLGGTADAVQAGGTARVQRSDGTVRDYRDVAIRLIGQGEVRVTSADGKGTLRVSKGACFYAGQLLRCLPYRIELDQSGAKRVIGFKRGTEYVNLSNAPAQLPRSSTHVPAHGILLLLLTARGTYITVSGTFDGTRG